LLLIAQGDHAEALPFFKEALVIKEESQGPEHPDVASYLGNIGLIFDVQGRYSEARPLLERTLAIRERTFRRPHPDVAMALHNLAVFLEAQGAPAEAQPLFEKGLRTTLGHLSVNLWAMSEADRFQYIVTQVSPEPMLLNLIAMGGGGPKKAGLGPRSLK